ncbi:2-dehydro-3-deoxyglucarate aldolase/4-hydroxy-2-oxoheptanedioate aldolase [Amycolatopsis pretoriensis]|uniref:2-dehydro-3-deoxyglucarate aldolase/4-hydroxy-2-oxoheptanedioate aldolase n=1 Tax=Amycolatopsis pretoriensis TaxID=218821 RepID=A0A1H5QE33_9PSEU|nr:aldolase/citrate lyase family protein [Amycolatopsis pretoriensis]SEF23497.1 2-dehydro-3-deoxyglucarate aldolase/4-hydroxy-2-oxoheptanedioate aldolase [Amycolatopsis pretoriensis]
MTDQAEPLLHRTPALHPGSGRFGPAIGIFLLSSDSMFAEACAGELDWVVLDMEAAPMSKREAVHLMQALRGSGCAPVVRVPWGQQHLIEHALDMGASGVMVPKVSSADDAAAAALACRFPPAGRRGINPVRASGYFTDVPGYLAKANDHIACVVQIESPEAVSNADEIAATPGVDGLFIGMGDLSSGYGQPGVMEGPVIDKARAAVLAAAARHGKRAGIFAYSRELARRYAEEGFGFIAVGNDIKLFREGLTDTLAAVRTPV